jgi:hypothetical protein
VVSKLAHPAYQPLNKVPTTAKAAIDWSTRGVHDICIDTGVAISIFHYGCLEVNVPSTKINVTDAVRPSGIGSNQTKGWVKLRLHLITDTQALVQIYHIFHVVTNSGTKIIMGNDILATEGACIDLASGRLTFPKKPGLISIQSWKEHSRGEPMQPQFNGKPGGPHV